MADDKVIREFGKAVCDRLGLPHGLVMRDWKASSVGRKEVMVEMMVIKVMPAEEYNELWDVARRRAQA